MVNRLQQYQTKDFCIAYVLVVDCTCLKSEDINAMLLLTWGTLVGVSKLELKIFSIFSILHANTKLLPH